MNQSESPETTTAKPTTGQPTATAQLWQQYICPLRQANCPCQQTCDGDGSPLPDPELTPAAAWEAWARPAADLLYQLVSNRRPELEQAGVASDQLFMSDQAAFHPDCFQFHADSSGVEYWYATLTLKPGGQAHDQFPEWEASVKQLCSWLFNPIQAELSRLGFELKDPAFSYTKTSRESPPVDWRVAVAIQPENGPKNRAIIDLMEAAQTELDEKDPYYQLLQEGPGPNPLFQQAIAYANQCIEQAWRLHSGQEPPAKPGLDLPEPRQAMSYCYAAAYTAFKATSLWHFTYTGATPFASEYQATADLLRSAAKEVSSDNAAFRQLLERAFARYTDNDIALPMGRRILAENDDLLEYKDIPSNPDGIPIAAE